MAHDNPAWMPASANAGEASAFGELPFSKESDISASGNSSSTSTLHTNNTGKLQLVEMCFATVNANYGDNWWMDFDIRDASDTNQFEVSGNWYNYPVILDPPLQLPDGWDINAKLENDDSSSRTVEASVLLRDIS